MKVLLVQDVENLGQAGEIKDVANGYARNYLIPQGLVVLATSGALKQADVHRRRAEKRRQRLAAEMAALGQAIETSTLNFKAKAGVKGRLYGSITTAEIAEALAQVVGKEIDRRKVALDEPIKQVGSHSVKVRLSAEVVPEFIVVVEPEDPDAVQLEPADEAKRAIEQLEAEKVVEQPQEAGEAESA